MKKRIILAILMLGVVIIAQAGATVLADLQTDWVTANAPPVWADQSGGQWQLYDLGGTGQKLQPDDWDLNPGIDGYDSVTNGSQSGETWMADIGGVITVGVDPSRNPGMFLWLPGPTVDNTPVHLEFRVDHVVGTAPIYVNIRDIGGHNGGGYLASWGILQDGGQQTGTLSMAIQASQLWIEIGSFNTGALGEFSMTITPEPATTVMLGFGILGLLRRRR